MYLNFRLDFVNRVRSMGIIIILFVIVSDFSVSCILTNSENSPIRSDLRVILSPSTLLHKRSTRASSASTSGGRWIPAVHPKFRKPLEGRFYNQRAVMPSHSQHSFPNSLRAIGPYLPPRLQITRPSQPEPILPPQQPPNQHPPPQHYSPHSSQSTSHHSSLNYPSPAAASLDQPGSDTYITEPQSGGEELLNNPSESELRFLFHRPEDENLIKSTILEESERYNERVSFVRGPTLKFQRRQTIYLPPRKKSVIYIMLKEPQVQTDLEVIEPQVDNTPEVNIVYEKNGGITTKHYYSTSDKTQNSPATGGTSGLISLAEYPNPTPHDPDSHQDLTSSGSEIKSVRIKMSEATQGTPLTPEHVALETKRRSSQKHLISNICQPIFNKKLKKR